MSAATGDGPTGRIKCGTESNGGADFDHLKAAHAAGTPIFVLRAVTDFNVPRSPGLPETQRPGPIADEKL